MLGCLAMIEQRVCETDDTVSSHSETLNWALSIVCTFTDSGQLPSILIPHFLLALRRLFSRHLWLAKSGPYSALPRRHSLVADLIFQRDPLRSDFALGVMCVSIPSVRIGDRGTPSAWTEPDSQPYQSSCARLLHYKARHFQHTTDDTLTPLTQTATDLSLFHYAHGTKHASIAAAESLYSAAMPIISALDSAFEPFLHRLYARFNSPSSPQSSVLHYRHHDFDHYKLCTNALRLACASQSAHLREVTQSSITRHCSGNNVFKRERAALMQICTKRGIRACDSYILQLVDFLTFAMTSDILDSACYCITFPYSAPERLLINIRAMASVYGANAPRLCLLPHGLPQLCMRTALYDTVVSYTDDPGWSLSFPSARIYNAGWPETLVRVQRNSGLHQQRLDIAFFSQLSGSTIHNIPSLLWIGVAIIKAIFSLPDHILACIRLRNPEELQLIPADLRRCIAGCPNVKLEYSSRGSASSAFHARVMVGSSSSALLYAAQADATCIQIVDTLIYKTWPFCLASDGYFFNLDETSIDLAQVFTKAVAEEVRRPMYPPRHLSPKLLAEALLGRRVDAASRRWIFPC
jgi:hypothetical protein